MMCRDELSMKLRLVMPNMPLSSKFYLKVLILTINNITFDLWKCNSTLKVLNEKFCL